MALFAYANALRRIKQDGGDKTQPGQNEHSPAFNSHPAPSVKPANDYPINPDNFKATVAGIFQTPTPAIRSMGRWQDSMQDFMRAAPFHVANAQAKATTARNNVSAIAADKLDSIQDGFNKHAAFLKLLVMETQASVNHGMEPTRDNVKSLIANVLKQHQRVAGQNTQHADLDNLADIVIGKLKPITGKTYRQELAAGEKVYSDSPLDKPRP